MTRYDCSCHLFEFKAEPRYNVDLKERLKELMGGEGVVSENTHVEYTFNGGYETLKVHTFGQGTSEYRGAYHPDVVCEGKGICIYCGTVMSHD
jgi:hypothetical protein